MKNLISIGYMNNDYYTFPEHQHSCWEIVYYTKGNGIVTIGKESIPFQAGQIICLPSKIPHSEISEKGYRNIHFSIETFENSELTIPTFIDNENQNILAILMQLHNEFHIRRKNWRNLTESLLNTAYQYMLAFSTNNKNNPYVEKIKELLILNLSKHKMSIKELMSELPLSVDHARRLFIKETSKTPTEYLIEIRISYAKTLLETHGKDGEMRVKDIAYLSGFEDPYYFSRVFKKITGKSPVGWMKKHSQLEETPVYS